MTRGTWTVVCAAPSLTNWLEPAKHPRFSGPGPPAGTDVTARFIGEKDGHEPTPGESPGPVGGGEIDGRLRGRLELDELEPEVQPGYPAKPHLPRPADPRAASAHG